jgi:hypothetical protein
MHPNFARHTVVDGEKWSLTTSTSEMSGHGPWAISDTLDVRITVSGQEYVIGTPDLFALPLPQPSKGLKGNVMISGLTVVRRGGNGGIEQETVRWSEPQENYIEPHKIEGVGIAHSEFQFFLGWSEAAAQNLMRDDVLAVIFEAYQTNTPCASCQKLIGMHLLTFAERSNKLAIFRGRARQIYESAPGKLGTALHRVGLGSLPLDRHGPAHIKEVLGLHKTIG